MPTKKHSFKVGDRVQVIGHEYAYEEHMGKVGVIEHIEENDGDDDEIEVRFQDDKHDWAFPADIKKAGRAVKSKTVIKFLLKYELDEDPIEEFATRAQVQERIKELLTDSSLKRDSMVVYEIKSRKEVKLNTTIRF